MKLKKILFAFAMLTINGSFGQTKASKLDSLYSELHKASSESEKLTIQNLIGEQYLFINIDSSLSKFDYVKNKSKSLQNKTIQANALIGIGKAYTNLAEYDSAHIYFQKAKPLFKNIDDYKLKSKLLMNEGVLCFYQTKYQEAKRIFEEVLEINILNNDSFIALKCYNNIALCLTYDGQYAEALEMHQKSTELALGLNNWTSVAKSKSNIGLIYLDLDERDLAESYLLKALEIYKRENLEVNLATTYINLGTSQLKLDEDDNDINRVKKAKQYYTKALNISKKANFVRGLNAAYVNLSRIENSLGNYEEGRKLGKIAVEQTVKSGDFRMEMHARTHLGTAYLYTGNFSLAENQLIKGLDIAKRNNEIFQKDIHFNLSELYEKKQSFDKALKHYTNYAQFKDSVSSVEVKNEVRDLEIKYETEKKEKEILAQRTEIAEKQLNINRKNTQLIGLGLLAVLLSVLGYLVYNQQKLKNRQLQKEAELKQAIARIETQNKLQEQRLRISRDLHDNIGAQLTFVISSIENLQYGFKIKNEKLTDKLKSIGTFTKDTIYELRDTIWAMNKNEISVEDLEVRISNFVETANEHSKDVNFSFTVDDNVSKQTTFSSVKGMNIYRIIQEAINNALKHAHANHISVNMKEVEGKLKVQITDDGKGFNVENITHGNGSNNMKKRAKEINAKIKIESTEAKGTCVTLVA